MTKAIRSHFGNIKTDPFRNFKFVIEFGGGAATNPTIGLTNAKNKIGFMAASGFSASHQVISYREGGDNTSVRKLPGQTEFGDITLTKGVSYGKNSLMEWFRLIFDVSNGVVGRVDNQKDFRARDLRVSVLSHPDGLNSQVVAQILVRNAWPSSLAFSDLDAGGNAVLVQQCVLAHEGWTYATALNLGNTDAVLSSNF